MTTESPGYYEAIAAHYDDIFPLNPTTLTFLEHSAGPAPAGILDIACGNATYTAALAEKGYQLEGIDLDAGMLRSAREKLQRAMLSDNVRLLEGDMLRLEELALAPADMAFCIGNSMVHLHDPEQMLRFLRQAHAILKPGGRMIIQIINYDRILDRQITALPPIKGPDGALLFERLYESTSSPEDANKSETHIVFHTRLHAEGVVRESRIPLYPLRSDRLQTLLQEAGFHGIPLLGDFSGTPYMAETSYALIVKALA